MRFVSCCAAVIVLACLAVPVRAGNIVTNGDFETGDFTGWLAYQNPNGGLLTVTSGVNNTPGGQYSASFGAIAPNYDEITQALATTVGDSYLLQFFVLAGDGTDIGTASFQQYLNGALAMDASLAGGDWTLFSDTFSGTGIDTLMFQGFNTDGYYFLDDVSVTDTTGSGVPEPGTFGLLGCALAGVGVASRRLRRRA